MSYFTKAVKILKQGGLIRLVKEAPKILYNRHIAPQMPKKYVDYNGVEVKGARYFDSIIPWRTTDKPNYESGIVSGINNYVNKNESVVIVGGGWGVTAVKAAQKVGDSGEVTVFEGSTEYVEHINNTILRNNVTNNINVVNSIVGPNISLREGVKNPSRLSPKDLPECDVLELDCEGSEIEILKNMDIRPRIILVESHGKYGSPSSKVETLLNDLNYTVESKVVADKMGSQHCIENDIYVLIGVKE